MTQWASLWSPLPLRDPDQGWEYLIGVGNGGEVPSQVAHQAISIAIATAKATVGSPASRLDSA
jgi:hypothetical protein